MYDDLSEADIQKMKEEIEYRKVVVRKEALTAVKEAREQGDLSEILNIRQRREKRIEMRAGSDILKEWSRRPKLLKTVRKRTKSV